LRGTELAEVLVQVRGRGALVKGLDGVRAVRRAPSRAPGAERAAASPRGHVRRPPSPPPARDAPHARRRGRARPAPRTARGPPAARVRQARRAPATTDGPAPRAGRQPAPRFSGRCRVATVGSGAGAGGRFAGRLGPPAGRSGAREPGRHLLSRREALARRAATRGRRESASRTSSPNAPRTAPHARGRAPPPAQRWPGVGRDLSSGSEPLAGRGGGLEARAAASKANSLCRAR